MGTERGNEARGATWWVKSRQRNRNWGQRIHACKGICFPQTPHLAQGKVPDQSFYKLTKGIAAAGHPAARLKKLASRALTMSERSTGERRRVGKNRRICPPESPGSVTY